jgi:hypothetical protein
MIDPTKSPTPTWQRYTVALLITVLIVVAGYVLWSKELHHKSTSASPPSTPATSTATGSSGVPAPKATAAPSTTIPGGIPISTRDPFGS